MARRGYFSVFLGALIFFIYTIAKILKRFYTIIHIFLILVSLAIFSVLGGLLFQLIESPPEERTIVFISGSRKRTLESAYKILSGTSEHKRQEFRISMVEYEINFIQATQNGTLLENGKAVRLWTFTGSTYFCVTTFTQLGFGNLAPKSTLGRVITMIYACFSIPVGALVFADVGQRINILITIAWTFVFNALRRCREEANKNVDDFGHRDTKSVANVNTNNSVREQGKLGRNHSETMMTTRLTSYIRFTVGRLTRYVLKLLSRALHMLFRLVCCSSLQKRRQQSPQGVLRNQKHRFVRGDLVLPSDALKKKSFRRRCTTACRFNNSWLRLALRSRLAQYSPRLSLGLLVLEVLRCLYLSYRRKFDRRRRSSSSSSRQSWFCSVKRLLNKTATVGFEDVNNNGDTERGPSLPYRSDPGSATSVRTVVSKPIGKRRWLSKVLEDVMNHKRATEHASIGKGTRSSMATTSAFPDGKSTTAPYTFSNVDARQSMNYSYEDEFYMASSHVSADPSVTKVTAVRSERHDEVVDDFYDDDYFDLDDDFERLLAEEKAMSEALGIIIVTVIMLIIYTVIGAFIILNFEKWTFFTSVWFLFMSIVTVGYGDVTPSSSKFLTYFLPYIILGVSIFGNLMGLAMLFFTNLTSKIRVIGKSYFDLYSAKAQVQKIEKKSKRSKRWWRILRQHIKMGLPSHLVEESRDYKLALFGRERDFIKTAFRIYFKTVYEDRMKEAKEQQTRVFTPELPAKIKKVHMPNWVSTRFENRPSESEVDGAPKSRLSAWQRFKKFVSRQYTSFRVNVSPGAVNYL